MSFAAAYAAFALWSVTRYTGQAGRDRFMALSDDRARAVHDQLTSSWIRWGIRLLLLQNTVLAGLGLQRSSWLDAAVGAAGVAAAIVALVLLPRARLLLLAAAADRALPAEPGRETSARRTRRVRQFQIAAVVAFAVAMGSTLVTEFVDSAWVWVVAGPAWLVTVLGFFAMAWASAWIYGDEQPAEAAKPGGGQRPASTAR